MQDLSTPFFATKEYPLRCSSIDGIVKCNLRGVYNVNGEETEGKKAAHTGSMVHKLVHEFHSFLQRVTVPYTDMSGFLGLAERIFHQGIKDLKDEFPEGDLEDARVMFFRYSVDENNNRATVVFSEEKVQYELPPADHDPTGQAIYIQGTLDQVRMDHASRKLMLWDIKCSNRQDRDIIWSYIFQYYAYYLGLLYKFQSNPTMLSNIDFGGFILPRKYDLKKNSDDLSPIGVFCKVPYRPSSTTAMVRSIQNAVANIRAGKVAPAPGNCYFCKSRGPEFCLPEFTNGTISLGFINRS
jgi:PD-(D/E)XK nuclease superfamily